MFFRGGLFYYKSIINQVLYCLGSCYVTTDLRAVFEQSKFRQGEHQFMMATLTSKIRTSSNGYNYFSYGYKYSIISKTYKHGVSLVIG